MASDVSFYRFVEDLFAPLGPVRIRKMFGGAGVYIGEDMFALLDDDQIYLKADTVLKAELEQSGAQPFTWTNPKTGRTITMSYVSMPSAALDDPDEAVGWARRALEVARRASRAKVKSPRRRLI